MIILVNTVNDPPVAADDPVTTAEDTPITINVALNDSEVDGNLEITSVTVVGQPANGSLTNNGDGTDNYSPAQDFFGSDAFTYQICDSDNACDDAQVELTVTPVNDAPACSLASPSVTMLWPPNHQFEPV